MIVTVSVSVNMTNQILPVEGVPEEAAPQVSGQSQIRGCQQAEEPALCSWPLRRRFCRCRHRDQGCLCNHHHYHHHHHFLAQILKKP